LKAKVIGNTVLHAPFVPLCDLKKILLDQLFLDDSERNIAAGKALGLRTALVRNQPTPNALLNGCGVP
jgi:hypothetical protein